MKPALEFRVGNGVHYRVHSEKVKCYRWSPSRGTAIAAFERACKQAGIAPPLNYPPASSDDKITRNDLAYPRHTCVAGVREGHGCVYVETRNDVKVR